MTREEAIAYGERVIELGLNDETQAFCELAISALSEKDWKFYYDHGYAQAKREFNSVIEEIKAEIAKIEIPKDVKTVDGSFAFCQALEIADLVIDRVVDKHIGKAESEG